MRAFFEGLGEFIEWTFGLITFLGNGMNYFFMIVIASMILYWLGQMVKHNKAGES